MSPQPLHPNLARLAAAYDQIIERFSRGELDAMAAKAAISTLVARDDEGVQWSIDPASGEWLRRTRTGEVVPGSPPAFGLATPTAHDLTRGGDVFNPDTRIAFTEVDESLLYPPQSLSGATRRPPQVQEVPALRRLGDWFHAHPLAKPAAAVVAVLAVVALALSRSAGPEPVPAPTPVTAPAPAPDPVPAP